MDAKKVVKSMNIWLIGMGMLGLVLCATLRFGGAEKNMAYIMTMGAMLITNVAAIYFYLFDCYCLDDGVVRMASVELGFLIYAPSLILLAGYASSGADKSIYWIISGIFIGCIFFQIRSMIRRAPGYRKPIIRNVIIAFITSSLLFWMLP